MLISAGSPRLLSFPFLVVARHCNGASFSISSIGNKKQMPQRPKVSEDEIEESFLKAVLVVKKNKTNSAVQLRHIPTGLVVKSQASRSRESNRKTARLLLAEKLEEIEKGEKSRKQILGAIKQKKAASKRKKANRKYRKLEEEEEKEEEVAKTETACDQLSNAEELGKKEEAKIMSPTGPGTPGDEGSPLKG